MIHLLLYIRNIQTNFERHGFELPDLHWPGCEEHLIFSAEYWACYLSHVSNLFLNICELKKSFLIFDTSEQIIHPCLQVSLTMYHPVGTCQMGKTTNPKAVVLCIVF